MRLRGFDYASPGHYFVTVCTCNRAPVFGRVERGEVLLSDFGRIVADCWTALPDHCPGVALDAWVIMPDHLHGIVVIHPPVCPAGIRYPTTHGRRMRRPYNHRRNA